MKAIGYVRVSTEEQADHGVSLEAQREKIRGYASLYGLELVGICSDEGASGSTLARVGLESALVGLKQGLGEAVIVAKMDRLTRSLPHLLLLIEQYFTDQYVLMSVAEQLDPRTAGGRLVMNILGAVAQWELETISERTKDALRHKRARGEYTGGGVPYGYRVDCDGRLKERSSEQDVIRLARKLREEGKSFRAIGKNLRVTLGAAPRSGGIWTPQQVKRIIEGGGLE